ncbi:uncharacterized protein [Musca autumnalis]|uniref:uncharacterized protein n=1 Tax=Musca autumnalis TaxID=221902 RepID=UPI003CF1F419
MSELKPQLCRLCLNATHGNLINLCNESGIYNDKYSITVKYFDSTLFDVFENHLNVLCKVCWQHIEEFHSFQNSVLESRTKLEKLQWEGDNDGYNVRRVKVENEEIADIGECAVEREQWNFAEEEEKDSDDFDGIVKEEVVYRYPDTLQGNADSNYASFTITDLNPNVDKINDPSAAEKCVQDVNTSLGSNLSHHSQDDDQLLDISEDDLDAQINEDDFHPESNKKSKIKRKRKQDLSSESLDLAPFVKIPQKRPLKSKREEELDNIIAQWKANLECRICKQFFGTYTLLHEHYKERHHNEEFYIECCELKIKKRGHLVEHIRMHIDYKAFKCSICERGFNRKRNLQAHLQRMHNIKNLESISFNDAASDDLTNCETREDCDRFISQYLPTLECVICKRALSTFSRLEEHFKRQHSTEEFHILCCGFRLNQQSLVVSHLKAHTHPRKYKCDLCNACFTMHHTLDHHKRTEHSNDNDGIIYNDATSIDDNTLQEGNFDKFTIKESDDFIGQWLNPLECELCKETFTTFSLLQDHFRDLHPNEKVFIRCCDKPFVTRHKVQRHIGVHLCNKAFKCELCGKRYSKKTSVQAHMLKQHYGHIPKNEKDKSEFTPTKRKTLKELDEIIAKWRPSLECLECLEANCATFTLLQQHFRQQHPAQDCYITCCDCKFLSRHDIEEHIRYHNDPDVFKCTHCDRRFARKRDSVRHMKSCKDSGK